MEFKRHCEIKRIEDKDIDISGEEGMQEIRIVTLEKGELKITLKGDRDLMSGCRTGDNVEVKITNSQTELFTPGEHPQ